MRALYTAATGMMAQETNVQVISNNIANLRTTGYKRQRAQFQDLLYETLRRPGAVTAAAGQQVPAGLEIGSGVKPVSTARAMSQGPISPTEREYDIAIRGEGFLRVILPDGSTAYTRDGSLNLDAQGQIVTSDGYAIDPPISVPANAVKVTISPNGSVQAQLQGQVSAQEIGQIQLSTFVNKSGLSSLGDNLFAETSASGAPSSGNPNEENRGNLQQFYLEEANVNAVTEISNLISAQRAYEMNSKVVTAADQMSSTTSQMFRG